MNYPLVVYGAGGHGKVVAEAAELSGWNVAGFVNDGAVRDFCGVITGWVMGKEVLSDKPLEFFSHYKNTYVIVAIGDNKIRMDKTKQIRNLGIKVATVIHPSAVVSKESLVCEGSIVCAGAIVAPSSIVQPGAIVNTGATVDHDSVVGYYSHIGPGVSMGGNVVVETGALVSIGSSVRDKIRIGAWSVVGVGSTVVSNVPSNTVSYGCPAKAWGKCNDA